MTVTFNIRPVPDLVERLSIRVGRMDQNNFPWQRKDARLLREARDMLAAIYAHVRDHGVEVSE